MRLSSSAQNKRLLAYLSDPKTCNQGINRFEAEQHLTICHLARRILDLKQSGYLFKHHGETSHDFLGHPHHGIRRYWLIGRVNQEIPNPTHQTAQSK